MTARKDKALEFTDEGYRVHVTGRHVEVTDAMKDYAMEKITKISRFSDRIIDVWITMDIQKLEHRIDVVLKVDHIKIAAEAVSENMYASIDLVAAKIKSQLSRYREKIRDHQARGVKAVDMRVNVIERPHREEDLINDEIEEETLRELESAFDYKVVKEETRPLKLLTKDEAIMKLDLSRDSFLVYRSQEKNQKLHILYKRKDGNFGLIEVEA